MCSGDFAAVATGWAVSVLSTGARHSAKPFLATQVASKPKKPSPKRPAETAVASLEPEKRRRLPQKSKVKPTSLFGSSGSRGGQKAAQRLAGARFRMLNERVSAVPMILWLICVPPKLYTTSGDDAFELFSSNPDLFQVYHEGFKTQVERWPVNPVE